MEHEELTFQKCGILERRALEPRPAVLWVGAAPGSSTRQRGQGFPVGAVVFLPLFSACTAPVSLPRQEFSSVRSAHSLSALPIPHLVWRPEWPCDVGRMSSSSCRRRRQALWLILQRRTWTRAAHGEPESHALDPVEIGASGCHEGLEKMSVCVFTRARARLPAPAHTRAGGEAWQNWLCHLWGPLIMIMQGPCSKFY